MKNKNQIKELRTAYLQNGYLPVAVRNAIVGDKTTGKAPHGNDWRQAALGRAGRAEWGSVQSDALNTGIVLEGLYAIDQDTDNNGISQDIENLIIRHFGQMPLKRFRQNSDSRFLTLFRAIGDHKKQRVEGDKGELLEVLATGQQFVSDGMHFTGYEIEWQDGVSPENFSKDELPLVTPEQMKDFLLDVKDLFNAKKYTISGYEETPVYSPTNNALNSSQDRMPLDDLKALVADLAPDTGYDDWFKTLAAIYNMTDGSFEGEQLAQEWSSRSTSYDKKAVKSKWKSFKSSPPKTPAYYLLKKIRQQIPEWISPSFRNPKPTYYPKKKEIVNIESSADETFDNNPSVDSVIAEYNKRFALVANGGKAFVVTNGYNSDLERGEIVEYGKDAFLQVFGNEYFYKITEETDAEGNIKEKKTRQSKAKIWFEHPKRRTCPNGYGTNPNGTIPSVYNRWQGFGIEEKQGAWPMTQRLIMECLAAGDKSSYDYIIHWLAHLIQKPTTSPETVLIFRGNKGTGKGTIGEALLRIMQNHGLQISHPEHLVGKFNGHMRDTLFMFSDEAFFAGNPTHENILKSLVTERRRINERKGIDAQEGKNSLHLMMASNAEWVVPASEDERRWAVFDVASTHEQDTKFFAEVRAEWDAGGLSAMLYDLRRYPVNDNALRKIPETNALKRQRELSLKKEKLWFFEILAQGYLDYPANAWKEKQTTDELYDAYKSWSDSKHDKFPVNRIDLGKFLATMFEQKRLAIGGKRYHGYVFGSLKEARARFDKVMKISPQWDDAPEDDNKESGWNLFESV